MSKKILSKGKPVTWFEVYGNDAKASQKFYAELFDWKVDTNYPMGYAIVEPEERGIRGGIGQANDMIPVKGPTFYVEVDDLDAYLAKAERLGGKIAMKPFQIPDGGPKIAVFNDIDGFPIGLTEPDPRF